MFEFGQEALPGTPEQMDDLIERETKKWHALIKARNIRLD